ncbi:MAG: glycosyltransferase [Armatimonadota bacterium]|nr:glycosyltransferase [Armatimonadota bacterium]
MRRSSRFSLADPAFAREVYGRVRRRLPVPARLLLDRLGDRLLGRPSFLLLLPLLAAMVRRRFDRHRLSVGWLLDGNEDDASARVRGFLPHAYLRQQGVHSVILSKPPRKVLFTVRPEEADLLVRARFDVVVFQRVHGPQAEALAQQLRATGTRTVYAIGDPIPSRMPEAVDCVVIASEGLRTVAGPDPEKVRVIESVVETPSGLVKDYTRPPRRSEIRVVWIGYPENLHLLEPVREALRDPRLCNYRLVIISRGPQATHQWDRRRVWRWLLDCDIAVLPSRPTEWYQAKPNTRMIMLKALGLPMVASPVPSYVATLTHGRGCFFARTVEEWADYLALLSDFDLRREMGLAERERILAVYGLEAVGRRWLSLFAELSGGTPPFPAVPYGGGPMRMAGALGLDFRETRLVTLVRRIATSLLPYPLARGPVRRWLGASPSGSGSAALREFLLRVRDPLGKQGGQTALGR